MKEPTPSDLLDFHTIGLRVGIEIHQQLDTAKLFCSCPSMLQDDAPDILVKRKLHAVSGETGEIDIAAEHEVKKELHNIYEAYSGSTCLVELDEEPPHEVNSEALEVCLQVCLLLNAKPVDALQFMRKTVLDGSNTSGFQRTGLIAANGFLDTSKGRIRITNICLEEEAARKIEETKEHTKWRLDRLGIPLIEIGTEADINSPEQCKEVAEILGMFLRSTGKAKRGIGTIRQDLNISIHGGARTEIKGAQDLRLMEKYVEYEALRQQNLLRVKEELEKRFLGKDLTKEIEGEKGNWASIDAEKTGSASNVNELTNIFKNSESKVIKSALSRGGAVLGIRLEQFAGLVGTEIQPGRRLGTELSDHAKIIAGVGGIFHSDELPGYGINAEEATEVCKELKLGPNDAFIIVADEKKRCIKALNAVLARARQCFSGIPKEVRKPNDDGTTSFMRPIPGAARMYPETDTRIIKIDTSRIKIPELISTRAERYAEMGISSEIAKQLAKSEHQFFFEKSCEKYQNISPAFIGDLLVNKIKEIKTRLKLDTSKIHETQIDDVLMHLNQGKISKEAVFEVLVELAKGAEIGVIKKYELLSDIELEKELKNIAEANKGLTLNALVGKAMSKLRGKADGQKIVKMIAHLQEQHEK